MFHKNSKSLVDKEQGVAIDELTAKQQSISQRLECLTDSVQEVKKELKSLQKTVTILIISGALMGKIDIEAVSKLVASDLTNLNIFGKLK